MIPNRTQLAQRLAEVNRRLPADQSYKFIGLGGIGSIAARFITMILAASGIPARVVLIDGDAFEPSNASRMFFKTATQKARAMREELLGHFGGSALTLVAVEEFLTPQSVENLISENDVVILAVDNHQTRQLASRRCEALANVILLSAGNDGVEQGKMGTYGNVQAYLRRDGKNLTPSLTKFHPEIENPQDRLPTDKSCSKHLVSTSQLAVTNLQAASALCSTFLLTMAGALHYSEISFDIATGTMQPSPLAPPHHPD